MFGTAALCAREGLPVPPSDNLVITKGRAYSRASRKLPVAPLATDTRALTSHHRLCRSSGPRQPPLRTSPADRTPGRPTRGHRERDPRAWGRAGPARGVRAPQGNRGAAGRLPDLTATRAPAAGRREYSQPRT